MTPLMNNPSPNPIDSPSGLGHGAGQAQAAVTVREATKTYRTGDDVVHALAGIDVDFAAGAFTAIMGPSGSGKSTLMHCAAGLDDLTTGTVSIGDLEISSLSEKKRTKVRRDRVGFIFQSFNLIPTLTVEENITLPVKLAGSKPDQDWVDEVIRIVSLGDRLGHRPDELSGGQRQRVAVARALASRPSVIFADEPTGNLDSRTGGDILRFMQSIVATMGQTIVMVTHDPIAAGHADRVVFLADGRIIDDMSNPSADTIFEHMKRIGG